MKMCETCGAPFKPRKPTSTTCSRRCANARTSRRTAAVRAEKMRGRGAALTYPKRGGRHEHRVVMEQMIGRPLRPGEVVHHIDENKLNNDPSNLQLFASQAEHARHHSTKNRRCEQDECERKHFSRGMCRMHYQRWTARRNGVKPRPPRAICTVDGCESLVNARGLCNKHYARAMRAAGLKS